jgi:hypothetical protein
MMQFFRNILLRTRAASTTRRQYAMTMSVAVALLVWSTLNMVPANAQTLPYASPHKTMGMVTCASSTCHGAVKPWTDSPILQSEYLIYTRTDKHTRAYKVLFNEQSKRIAKNLGLTTPAHEASVCLDCHGHNVPTARHGERFSVIEGITCESCHGPAEKWTAPHVNPSGTPAAHHASNVANGLYPLNDPVARAKVCLSCHFGNKDKLVTHRIMGAGHPRMSFELETFTEMAPKHFVVDKDYRERKRVWEGVQTWAVGQAIAVAETMEILLDDKRGRDGAFPELVLFDCHACHHPMSGARWQPKGGLGMRVAPGLVRLNDSNMLMLRAVAAGVDAKLGEQMLAQMQKLNRAIAGEGDVKAEAANLRKMALDAAPLLGNTAFTPALVQKVMAGLIQQGMDGQFSDYAAAEQTYLALQSMGAFLSRQGALNSPANFNTTMGKLAQVLAQDEKYQPQQFVAQMKDLKVAVIK